MLIITCVLLLEHLFYFINHRTAIGKNIILPFSLCCSLPLLPLLNGRLNHPACMGYVCIVCASCMRVRVYSMCTMCTMYILHNGRLNHPSLAPAFLPAYATCTTTAWACVCSVCTTCVYVLCVYMYSYILYILFIILLLFILFITMYARLLQHEHAWLHVFNYFIYLFYLLLYYILYSKIIIFIILFVYNIYMSNYYFPTNPPHLINVFFKKSPEFTHMTSTVQGDPGAVSHSHDPWFFALLTHDPWFSTPCTLPVPNIQINENTIADDRERDKG